MYVMKRGDRQQKDALKIHLLNFDRTHGIHYDPRMQLTLYTDYSLRALLYIGRTPDRLVTISEIADFYGVSRNHMVKVIHHLGSIGYLTTIRGKAGGVRLARPAGEIRISEVVQATEPHMDLQECFNPHTNTCPLTGDCRLKGVLYQARAAFMGVLAGQTLADLLPPSLEP